MVCLSNFYFPIDASIIETNLQNCMNGWQYTYPYLFFASIMKTEKIELCFCLVNLVPLLKQSLLLKLELGDLFTSNALSESPLVQQ